jgi:hypothetical protein
VTIAYRFLLRRGLAATLASVNEVPLEGEMVIETDTRKFKFGDGATAWNSLAYASGLSSSDIGVSVQAYDADLTAIAALTSAADRVPYATGAGTWALATFTAFGRSLVDDVDAAAGRTTLALGTSAVKNTGTSGDAVPLLNGAATTWAAGSTWGSGGTGGGLTIVGLNATSNAGAGGFFSWQRDGTNRLWIGDKEAIIGSGSAAVYYAFSGAPHQFYVSGSFRFEVTTDGAAVTGNMFIANTSAPATPTGGGVIYVESGALKYKGSSGTVTTLAAA